MIAALGPGRVKVGPQGHRCATPRSRDLDPARTERKLAGMGFGTNWAMRFGRGEGALRLTFGLILIIVAIAALSGGLLLNPKAYSWDPDLACVIDPDPKLASAILSIVALVAALVGAQPLLWSRAFRRRRAAVILGLLAVLLAVLSGARLAYLQVLPGCTVEQNLD